MTRRAWLSVVILLAAGSARAAPVPAPASRELDPKVIAAWQKAGFRLLWVYSYDYTGHPQASYARPTKGKALPLLTWDRWRAGVLPKLPSPNVPFALSL